MRVQHQLNAQPDRLMRNYLTLILGVEADDERIIFSMGAWRRMADRSDDCPEKEELLELMGDYPDSSLLCFTRLPAEI